ncbi:HAD-IIIC family phosphatase [Oscillochloris sp. ZM17-4]|uniref:HAD-IIIC family phosphatase n=1 Tax=Oscillochloris sp. ZM17-4 TaxID=2866714 RepID=UPI001C72BBF2|nr:HAD-IIIC family phosphatase [Oscillochloris sp. ZM17-4]MBX0331342.1 HAD-IIIC family phosphatase [Oscillochloris sp. ZM17-4]
MRTTVCLNIERLPITEAFVTAMLAQVADEDVLDLVDNVVGAAPDYDEALIEACLAAIESRGLADSASLAPYLDAESPWWESARGSWIAARLLEIVGPDDAALAAWGRVIDRGGGALHKAYLARTRVYRRLGRIDEAFADLRRAIVGQEEYGFLTVAARLLDRLSRQGVPPAQRKARIAILSSTTSDLMVSLLRLACFRDGIDASLYVGPYGNIQQEILSPASGLYAFAPDFVLIATHWHDANLPPFSARPDDEVQRVVGEVRQLWESLLQRHACRIIQHNFELPPIDAYGHLGLSLPGGRGHMLREINRRLLEIAPGAVAVLDLDHVAASYGKRRWSDMAYWYTAKQYPAADALVPLIDRQAALVRAGLGLAKKVLALDLDNTLWGGVIGEDGLEGIRLGPPSAVGEAHQALQRYAAELKERGVLLVVCSKNNDEDARLPFLHHDAMVLRLDDIVLFRANWRDKPANLREIASQLNLGVDSFVFLDDNPAERDLMRRELPEVATPECGADPAGYIAALDRGLYFESWALSQEDRERHLSYRSNALRAELQAVAPSLEDFLRSLDMVAEIGVVGEPVLARVAQLIGKTNQFNLTSRRRSEAEIRQLIGQDGSWTQYFKLNDRFGDNGLVGVMIARRVPADISTWEIDTWLMSCRVIGRQMEQLMLQTLIEAAYARGVRALRGVYTPTAKNAMVAQLYPRLGFALAGEQPDGTMYYGLDLTSQATTRCEFIRVRSEVVSR